MDALSQGLSEFGIAPPFQANLTSADDGRRYLSWTIIGRPRKKRKSL